MVAAAGAASCGWRSSRLTWASTRRMRAAFPSWGWAARTAYFIGGAGRTAALLASTQAPFLFTIVLT